MRRISADARVPVIKHLDGNCHVYIDDRADLQKAVAIALNAKTHRYGVCNAMESLLVAESVAGTVLPELAALYAEKKVELRGCDKTCANYCLSYCRQRGQIGAWSIWHLFCRSR